MAALIRIRKFLQLEAAGGIILFLAAVAAFLISNSPLSDFYQRFFQMHLAIQLGSISFSKSLLFWINEGLMAIFFLLIGLELKREFVEGELAEVNKVILPGVAALGGMVFPAFIYLVFNFGAVTAKGWAIPVATDIAFALGVLSLAGKKIPHSLKLFLMTLAIFDDLGAIIIIAVHHTKSLSWTSIILAGFIIVVLFSLNRIGSRKLFPYLILGVFLWLSVLKSGVHATIAGVILALMIPATHKKKSDHSTPLHYLERRLHPLVAYLILPLFAFANAGVNLKGVSLSIFGDPLVIGIIAGLFLGKQFGVLASTFALVRLGWAKIPTGADWLQIYGVACVCGIGFTMSLFLGTLAFSDSPSLYIIEVQIGVLSGSMLSGIVGFALLQMAFKKRGKGGSPVETE